MNGITTPEIIQRAAKGDRDAFRIIVEEHQSFVYAIAYRFVNHSEDAEDLTQESFIRLWNNLSKYTTQAKLSTWLYTIVTNVCLDFLKSSAFKKRRDSRQIETAATIKATSTADQEVNHKELERIVHEVAETLTPKQKAAFILRDLEGVSVEEICNILNMTPGNLKSNLYYARQRVQEKLRIVYSTPTPNLYNNEL